MIVWTEVHTNQEIHGTLPGHNEPVFLIRREKEHPYSWEMIGLCDGKSQYRNDLKSAAEHHIQKFNIY